MSLSICMIARNEERCIGRALRSVLDVADDIVVVDTGSTDSTKEIAAGLGARVFDFKWCDDFAAARNFALEQADRTKWQAWLDADDELVGASAKRLNELKRDPADCVIGWRLENVGVLPSAMHDVGALSTFQQRMFPRGVLFRNAVHETITKHAAELGLQTYNFNSIIVKHHGYDGVDITDKLYRNSRILAVSEGMPPDVQGFELDDKYFAFYANGVVAVIKDMTVIGAVKLPAGQHDATEAVVVANSVAQRHAELPVLSYDTPSEEYDMLEDQIDRLTRALEGVL